jgi:peptide chain release factor 1
MFLQVRAGTGGLEASLFAAALYSMYEKYAVTQGIFSSSVSCVKLFQCIDIYCTGWRFERMSYTESDVGGVREASFSLTGSGVFGKLKHEAGVHRVQRVPATETAGRVHTSTATVAILPEAQEVDVKINERDLKIEVFRARGAGGQSVNKTESAVRLTHVPTGLTISMQDERSQHQNKAKAMRMLQSKLYQQSLEKQRAERSANRMSQVFLFCSLMTVYLFF